MNNRSVKFIGATLIGFAGMFTASYALAGKDGGGDHGGYGGHGDDAELKNVDCKVKDGKITAWGEVKGSSRGLKVVLKAEGKAETECINPADKEVEAQGDKKYFDIKKSTEIDYNKFTIHAKVGTDAKCEGKENWEAKTRLDFENDEFRVKLVEKKSGDEVDEVECRVKNHDCDCYPAGGGGGKW